MRLLLILSVLLIQSCYSFKGISIPPNVDTYSVPFIEMTTPDAPPSINTTLQDKLIIKINTESRLTNNENNPDILLKTTLTRFNVQSVGANAENSVDANQLTISLKVEYTDFKNEDNSWNKNFSNNREFPAGTNLLTVQDQLVDEIFDDLVEDIFNQAFTNW
jgi:hypothetical protein